MRTSQIRLLKNLGLSAIKPQKVARIKPAAAVSALGAKREVLSYEAAFDATHAAEQRLGIRLDGNRAMNAVQQREEAAFRLGAEAFRDATRPHVE